MGSNAMAKPPKKTKPEEIETEPDAWERFEKTIGKIVPPKQKPKPKPKLKLKLKLKLKPPRPEDDPDKE